MPDDIISSYADDTAVIITDETWSKVESKMNNYINSIYKWLACNRLSLNIDKTVYLTFGNYCDSVPIDFKVQIEGKTLKRVEYCKYLGVVFDYKMSWKKHTEYLLNKTKYLVFVFRKISRFMTNDTLRMLYYAFFHSVFSYGIIAWGGLYANSSNLIQNLQNRLLKIVNKDQSVTHNSPFNLKQCFAYESLYFHYNALREKYTNSKSITRNKSLKLPQICKAVGGKNSFMRAVTLFNSLPNELKLMQNVKTKKNKLKNWVAANI